MDCVKHVYWIRYRWKIIKYSKNILNKFFFFFFLGVMDPIMNLISKIINLCEKRKYTFNILPEYLIITRHIRVMMSNPVY